MAQSNLLSAQTELEAVNRMLESIGQAPVNSLDVSGISDVTKARNALRETSRDLQTAGWSWNTDTSYTLSPDVNGYIAVPPGVLDIDATDTTINVTPRANPNADGAIHLWDGDNHTFVFSGTVDCDITWGFPFETLPQAARTYIATSAARRFQAQLVSSPVLDRYNEEDVQAAWLLLQRKERAARDTNIFRVNTTVSQFFNRRRF